MEPWMIILLVAIGGAALIITLFLILKGSNGMVMKKLCALQQALPDVVPTLANEIPTAGKHLTQIAEYVQSSAIFYASYEVANAMASKGIRDGYVMCGNDAALDTVVFDDETMGRKNVISLAALGITVQNREQMEALLCAIIMCMKVCIECGGLLYECFNGKLSAECVPKAGDLMFVYTIG